MAYTRIGDSFDRCKQLSVLRKFEARKISPPQESAKEAEKSGFLREFLKYPI